MNNPKIYKIYFMKKIILVLIVQLSAFHSFCQNVGVGVPIPSEKLDVNGNINVSGTIKANGSDGLPNQVLMKNSSGTFAWGNVSLADYKNFATFLASNSWLVPAGVTKISIELWGAGGGGTAVGGGGGGGYIMGVFTVTPGSTINFFIGVGGNGASNSVTSGNSGTTTSTTIGGIEIDAYGGQGGVYNSAGSYYSSGDGGAYFATAGFTAFMGMSGQKGSPTKKNYAQAGTSLFYEMDEMGNGGDGANSENTGAKGTYYISTPGSGPAPADVRFYGNNTSKVPGGGGSSYFVNSSAGAAGMVVIHY
jgi:hypothetical protein